MAKRVKQPAKSTVRGKRPLKLTVDITVKLNGRVGRSSVAVNFDAIMDMPQDEFQRRYVAPALRGAYRDLSR